MASSPTAAVAQMMSKGVASTHPDYDAYKPKWKRVRDVIAGTDAMHAAGEEYLPKFAKEDDPDYKARVKRSDFFNGTWRTIDALGGMAFRKSPTQVVPAAIDAYLDDVTLSGKSIESLAKETLEEVLGVGRIGILVDHPRAPENVTAITVKTAQDLGLRPTLQLYPAESIINWTFGRINNAWTLTMVVLKEQTWIAADEFSGDYEDRYRVLDLNEGSYRQRLYRKAKDGTDELLDEFTPLMAGKPLGYIPFSTIGTCGRNDDIDEPPLIDLVDKNVAHYQVNSDYRHGAHFTALPTLFLAGIKQEANADPVYIGGSTAIVSPYPEARGEYVEYKGQGLTAVSAILDRLEKQMALLGARAIADETQQVETLGATQLKRAAENAVLSKVVQAVSEALEWALEIFAEWAGAPKSEITYQINRDFLPAMMDGQALLAVFQGRDSGAISDREAFELLQRGDVIDGEVTFEQHQEEVASSAPAKPTKPAANDGTGGMAA